MLTSVPVRVDLFSIFILLGVCQGLFLVYFFLVHSASDKWQNRYLGLLMLSFALIIADVWLGYTNYMFHVLFLVDCTEPLNFILPPALFLYIKTSLIKRFEKKQLLHFIPFTLYFLYMCLFIYFQPLPFKYNAYIGAFHPELDYISASHYGPGWIFFLTDKVNELTFVSMSIYQVWGFILITEAFKKEKTSFFSNSNKNLAWLRNLSLHSMAVVTVFLIIRLSFESDMGDHIIAAHIAYVIYVTSFSVIRQSVFIHGNEKPVKKYEKSSLDTETGHLTVKKLNEIMQTDHSYLQPDFSLAILAKKTAVSPHHLSQVLNDIIGQNFFEYTAFYRVEEAKKILLNHSYDHLKIEEIAEMVGYNSKSAFNTAFKKNTGLTPSEYRAKYSV